MGQSNNIRAIINVELTETAKYLTSLESINVPGIHYRKLLILIFINSKEGRKLTCQNS